MDLNSATITLGMQTSREDNRTNDHVLAMRKLLAEYCEGPYIPEISRFGLNFRIGGEMQEFDFEGCERIRRNRKQRNITLDLGFPSRRWKGATDSSIREYIADTVETGLLCCIRRLEKDKSPVNSAGLMHDFARVKQLFLECHVSKNEPASL